VTCVRWYLRFFQSLRDLEELMADRGLSSFPTLLPALGGIAPKLDQARLLRV
jgi:transposase-like protein